MFPAMDIVRKPSKIPLRKTDRQVPRKPRLKGGVKEHSESNISFSLPDGVAVKLHKVESF